MGKSNGPETQKCSTFLVAREFQMKSTFIFYILPVTYAMANKK